jgi:hypothetical protein
MSIVLNAEQQARFDRLMGGSSIDEEIKAAAEALVHRLAKVPELPADADEPARRMHRIHYAGAVSHVRAVIRNAMGD